VALESLAQVGVMTMTLPCNPGVGLVLGVGSQVGRVVPGVVMFHEGTVVPVLQRFLLIKWELIESNGVPIETTGLLFPLKNWSCYCFNPLIYFFVENKN
jgi:hypothetical protein